MSISMYGRNWFDVLSFSLLSRPLSSPPAKLRRSEPHALHAFKAGAFKRGHLKCV